MLRKLTWLCAALALTFARPAIGQDALLEDLYGRGVHAFFDQNMREAFDSLNAAIQGGSRDPRAFYFRGMVLSRFGRPEDAAIDFRKGAELEAVGGVPYPVGRALERIQGPERAMVEAHRRATRVALHNTQTARDRVRYEQARQRETEVLRGAPRPAGAAIPAAAADSTDPFGAPPPARALTPPTVLPTPVPETAPVPVAPLPDAPGALPPAVAPTAPPPTPAPAPADDPFATPAAPAPTIPAPAAPQPAEPTPPVPVPVAPADPFATPAAPPAPVPTAPTAPPADDPFAPPAAPTPTAPAPTTPAPAPTPPAPSDDPFATPTAPAPAPAPPATP